MTDFVHFDLRYVEPDFGSPLTSYIIELDHLRKKRPSGSTPSIIFFQLKHIFHMLESVASARIEGNKTTVADYVETKIQPPKPDPDSEIQEIINMEKCLEFIERNVNDTDINRAFVRELHKIVVAGLPIAPLGEGDKTPGAYRKTTIKIQGSQHTPPDPSTVDQYMDGLFTFINKGDEPKYDLLKIALAHHRFVWIHPFNNGNGRAVRMLTYAMLVKYGFNVNQGRLINPAAVFCSNREEYYNKLSVADKGDDHSLLVWCEYVLAGLGREIQNIDRLLEYSYLKDEILLPAVAFARDREWITAMESLVLKKAIELKEIKSADLSSVIKTKHSSQRSRVISRLKQKKMIQPVTRGARRYAICFQNNYLARAVVHYLLEKKFVSVE